jgi:hypothetical protein
LACAKIPKIGIKTADRQKPKLTNHQSAPDLNPSNGGNIKFPAPKKSEKRAKAMTRVSLVLFMVGNSDGKIKQKEQKTTAYFIVKNIPFVEYYAIQRIYDPILCATPIKDRNSTL